ncbi:hypothetical protein KUF54_10855 [Comamonas sp. Y33R10-2]|uniref:LPS-assembly lipoprotein LptE n=1 Tax=Comamonas sp. Y33R10-2 TaxID=2853257 RepID=UPI001C5CBFB5|nr:LPS assembly lipoprotein LptE [Comamonas sp. Y33R10-2]QXZ08575.1 hypothetical protein KUF54_10855 [Comamonas sp. Y33R10-2]
MQKRTLLAAMALTPLLGACGFRLRGAPNFVFRSIYVQAGRGAPVGTLLRRNLESSSDRLVVIKDPASPDTADVICQIVGEQAQRIIIGSNVAGQVREIELRLLVTFSLRTPGGDMVIEPTTIRQIRNVTYNETNALSKAAEEEMLNKDMRNDIVQQIIRRLGAVKSLETS